MPRPPMLPWAKICSTRLRRMRTNAWGLAANMIGVRKRVIVAACAGGAVLMYNPEIVEASGEYQTEESCLSLEGSRLCTRYRRIKVAYLDASFTLCKKSFSGFDAQIVQHEIDHCNGVVI